MRVLITGVAGFIGSHVASECLKLGFNVVGVDDLSGGYEENVPKGVDFKIGTVTDIDFISQLLSTGQFDYIYHLAAYAAEGLSHFIRHFNYQTNVLGSINLINAAILNEVKCFVFTSSIAVYGTNQTPMTESLVPSPEDPYGIAKLAVELDLAAASHMFGMPFIIFRPHNVYGERQNTADPYRNVIGIFMRQIMRDQALTIFGDGRQTRAFSYVGDVAPIIALAPTVPSCYNNVFNVGADQPFTVNQLAREIGTAFGVEPKMSYLPERKEVLHAFADHSKVKAYFPSPGPTALADGISRMANWVRRQPIREPIPFAHIEIKKSLPAAWRSFL